jgi:predicted GNAT family acetyltransferase
MNIDFKHESNRVYALGSAGSMIAEITFPETAPGRVNINHTYVHKSMRGQGIGDKLVRAAIHNIRSANLKAVATCPFAVKWFENHPEYGDILH